MKTLNVNHTRTGVAHSITDNEAKEARNWLVQGSVYNNLITYHNGAGTNWQKLFDKVNSQRQAIKANKEVK